LSQQSYITRMCDTFYLTDAKPVTSPIDAGQMCKLRPEGACDSFPGQFGSEYVVRGRCPYEEVKHIDVRYHFSSGQVRHRNVIVKDVGTKDMFADILIKPLSGQETSAGTTQDCIQYQRRRSNGCVVYL
jgi:hypothetical protein